MALVDYELYYLGPDYLWSASFLSVEIAFLVRFHEIPGHRMHLQAISRINLAVDLSLNLTS